MSVWHAEAGLFLLCEANLCSEALNWLAGMYKVESNLH